MGTPVSGVLHIGRVPAEPVGPDNKLLPQILGDLTAACFRIHCPDDVLAWKYRKLISNLGNIFEALVGPSKEVQHLREAAEREARAVLDAADIAYTSDDEESTARAGAFSVRPVAGVAEHLCGSTWQSLTRGDWGHRNGLPERRDRLIGPSPRAACTDQHPIGCPRSAGRRRGTAAR
jgi:2-dehydropantoate 2-reductase